MTVHPFDDAFRLASEWTIETAVRTARDRDAPLTQRQAAVANVLRRSGSELSDALRNNLIREFLFDDSTIIQRLAISVCDLHTSRQTVICDLWRIADLGGENKWCVLRALARFGERRVIDVCLPILRDGAGDDVVDAASAVGFLANGEACALLEDLFEQTTVEPLRFVLASGIVRCGGASATPYLEEYLDAFQGPEQIVCMSVLVRGGSAKGERLLADLLERSSPSELEFVRTALTKLNIAAASSSNWVEATKDWLENK